MIRLIWSMVLFNPIVAVLMDVSVDEDELFKLPAIIESVSLHPFYPVVFVSCIKIQYVCIVHVCAPCVCAMPTEARSG